MQAMTRILQSAAFSTTEEHKYLKQMQSTDDRFG
jgi:hypothetical protein